MQVKMIKWVKNIPNLPAWFIEGETIELTFDKLEELYDAGLNVMLKHYPGGNPKSGILYSLYIPENWLCVDVLSFGQR